MPRFPDFDFVENCRIADCVARMAEIRHCLLGSACIRMPSRHRSVQLSETRTTQTHPDTGKTVGVTSISLSSFYCSFCESSQLC